MFGFGKAREPKAPKEPKRQGYITEQDTWVTFGPEEKFVYEGKRWGLVRQGTVWPPVAADHGDRPEFWTAVAEGLNNLGANRAILKRIRQIAADYKANKITATQVTDMVLRLDAAAKDIQVGGE